MNSTDAVRRLMESLESTATKYVLVGALASNVYSISRSTKDADVVVAFEAGVLNRLLDALGPDFRFNPQMMIEVLTGSIRNEITFLPTGFLIDLFRLSDDIHHRELVDRRVRAYVSEIALEVWVPTVEDIVVQKVRWGRRKDQDDVVNILSLNHEQLDWDYVFSWTDSHGTSPLLRQLSTEVPGLKLPPEQSPG